MKVALTLLLAVAVSHVSASPIVTSTLSAKLKANGVADIMIIMKDETAQVLNRVKSQSFASLDDKVTTLKNELRKFTSESQKEVLALVSKHRTSGAKGFYITNRISVKQAPLELVSALEKRSDIAQIREPKVMTIETPVQHEENTPKVLEWGVGQINAPQAWEKGFTGEGIVVSNIDTGVRYTHEALVAGWRGEAYGWFDPYLGTPTPNDQNVHGTHTMGSIAGRNGTGVAQGATWIACKGCDSSSCMEEQLLSCGEWTLCPTLADGTAEDCSQRPRVSSNSWGGGSEDAFYNDIIDSWNVAKIIPIFSIGNSGPNCRTAGSPGDQPNVISVGATNTDDTIATFSSHGPSSVAIRIKPEVSAPGNGIRSASNAGDRVYVNLSGTSMAGPHVAGATAILLQKNPDLDTPGVLKALGESAFRPELTQVVCTGGGVDPSNPWPNNSHGWGRIDVDAALSVNATMA